MTSRAERYRQLARDLHFVSKPTARGAPFRVAGNGRGMGPLGRPAGARHGSEKRIGRGFLILLSGFLGGILGGIPGLDALCFC